MDMEQIRELITEEWNRIKTPDDNTFTETFRACAACPNASLRLRRHPGRVVAYCFCMLYHRDMDNFPDVCMGTAEYAE